MTAKKRKRKHRHALELNDKQLIRRLSGGRTMKAGELNPGVFESLPREQQDDHVRRVQAEREYGIHQGYLPGHDGTIGKKALKRVLATMNDVGKR
jgi:hypothetical protein